MALSINSDSLGRLGEQKFALLCTEAGLIANRSADWDRTGWDYLVEFPFSPPTTQSTLDFRLHPPEGKVQVKTVGPGSNRIKLRLSAAERLVTHPQTAFICVLVVDAAQEFTALYLLHVMDDLLSRMLLELRRCQAKNSLLINKTFLTLHFDKYATKKFVSGDGIKEAIEKACEPKPDVYAKLKQEQRENLGFSNVRYTGRFTIKAANSSDFAHIMLGMKTTHVNDFSVSEIRWGITWPKIEDSSPAELSISPHPISGELSIKNKDFSENLLLKVDVRVPLSLGLSSHYCKIRLSNSHLEMILDPESNSISLESGLGNKRPFTIRAHLRVNKLQRLLTMNDGIFELKVRHRHVFRADFQPMPSSMSESQIRFAHGILTGLRNILVTADAEELSITISEINEQIGIIQFVHNLISDPKDLSISGLSLAPTSDFPSDLKTSELLVLGHLTFGASAIGFCAVGRVNILDAGETKTLEISELNARQVEQINGGSEAVDEFSTRMSGETGIGFVLNLGGGAAISKSSN